MHSTPSRDRERLPFPQSANPSPGPSLRQSAVSTSTSFLTPPATSSSPSVSSSHQALTVEALLKQHASASDPKSAALSQVVADRNVLSAQNAQLWKLIEKQRAGYNTILKELERIRTDRDSYKSKYAALMGTPNGHGDRKPKSGDRVVRPSVDSQSGSVPAVHANTPRQGFSRHHSDDTSMCTFYLILLVFLFCTQPISIRWPKTTAAATSPPFFALSRTSLSSTPGRVPPIQRQSFNGVKLMVTQLLSIGSTNFGAVYLNHNLTCILTNIETFPHSSGSSAASLKFECGVSSFLNNCLTGYYSNVA